MPKSRHPSPTASHQDPASPSFSRASAWESGVSGGRITARAKNPSTGWWTRPRRSAFLRSRRRASPKTRTPPPSRGTTTGMAP